MTVWAVMARGRQDILTEVRASPNLTIHFFPGSHSYQGHGPHSVNPQPGQGSAVQRLSVLNPLSLALPGRESQQKE